MRDLEWPLNCTWFKVFLCWFWCQCVLVDKIAVFSVHVRSIIYLLKNSIRINIYSGIARFSLDKKAFSSYLLTSKVWSSYGIGSQKGPKRCNNIVVPTVYCSLLRRGSISLRNYYAAFTIADITSVIFCPHEWIIKMMMMMCYCSRQNAPQMEQIG